MNYFIIPICILLTIAILHLVIVSKRLANYCADFFFEPNPYDNFIEYHENNLFQRQKIFFTLFLFLLPLVLYKTLIISKIFNFTISMSLLIGIVLIALLTFWLNVYKNNSKFSPKSILPKRELNLPLLGKDELSPVSHSNIYQNIDDKILTPLSEKKTHLETLSEKNNKEENISAQISSNLILFQEFIGSHKEFENFSSETNQFELSNFSISGTTTLKQSHASLILIVYFFEEILKNKNYMSELDTDYYVPLNNFFKNNMKIKRSNWSSFKKKYLKDSGINSLKSSDFYKELLQFHKKTGLK